MISLAVHAVFVWVLGMTMVAKKVEPPTTPKPEIRLEQKAPEKTLKETEPEVKPPVVAPL
jgi:hypothetical protein